MAPGVQLAPLDATWSNIAPRNPYFLACRLGFNSPRLHSPRFGTSEGTGKDEAKAQVPNPSFASPVQGWGRCTECDESIEPRLRMQVVTLAATSRKRTHATGAIASGAQGRRDHRLRGGERVSRAPASAAGLDSPVVDAPRAEPEEVEHRPALPAGREPLGGNAPTFPFPSPEAALGRHGLLRRVVRKRTN